MNEVVMNRRCLALCHVENQFNFCALSRENDCSLSPLPPHSMKSMFYQKSAERDEVSADDPNSVTHVRAGGSSTRVCQIFLFLATLECGLNCQNTCCVSSGVYMQARHPPPLGRPSAGLWILMIFSRWSNFDKFGVTEKVLNWAIQICKNLHSFL